MLEWNLLNFLYANLGYNQIAMPKKQLSRAMGHANTNKSHALGSRMHDPPTRGSWKGLLWIDQE